MKPFCRILSSYKNLGCYCTLQSPNLLYLSGSLWNFGRFCSYSNQFLGVQRIIDHGKSEFCHSGSSLDLSRICCRTGLVPSTVGLYRKLCVIRYAVSDVRNCSLTTPTSKVEPCVKFKQFVVDRITKDVGSESGEIIEEKVENDKRESDNFEVRALKREESGIEKDAWRLLQNAVVSYCNSPVGTVAANDPNDKQTLNYDQVFIRDFVPSALAFLMKGEGEIVKNFLIYTMQLQSREKTVDCYSPGQGLMPASFKVRTIPLDGADGKFEEVLDPDFGESAIGRVAPVDSGLWWIILLRAYGKLTGDYSLQERVDVQTGMRLILNLSLTNGFDMFPSLLVTDGSCMIDRRMGFHGHPLEIQALFYSALRCSREMLNENDGSKNLVTAINNRLSALSFHIREYYWVDMKKINEIYRYKTEEYLMDAINKFNIYPGQIPHWLMDWISEEGGYMIGIFNQLTWILDSSRSGICGALFHHWVLRDRIRLF